MKKLFFLLIVSIIAFNAPAQIIRSTTSEVKKVHIEKPKPEKSWNHSGLFIDAGIGVLTGDFSDFGIRVDWGYRWHIAGGFSWEVFRLEYCAGVSDFKTTSEINATTGFRYDSMRIPALANKSLYASINLGYGGLLSGEEDYYDITSGGFTYDIGIGIKLNRKTSVGLFYQGLKNKAETWSSPYWEFDINWGMVGAKIEYQFR